MDTPRQRAAAPTSWYGSALFQISQAPSSWSRGWCANQGAHVAKRRLCLGSTGSNNMYKCFYLQIRMSTYKYKKYAHGNVALLGLQNPPAKTRACVGTYSTSQRNWSADNFIAETQLTATNWAEKLNHVFSNRRWPPLLASDTYVPAHAFMYDKLQPAWETDGEEEWRTSVQRFIPRGKCPNTTDLQKNCSNNGGNRNRKAAAA